MDSSPKQEGVPSDFLETGREDGRSDRYGSEREVRGSNYCMNFTVDRPSDRHASDRAGSQGHAGTRSIGLRRQRKGTLKQKRIQHQFGVDSFSEGWLSNPEDAIDNVKDIKSFLLAYKEANDKYATKIIAVGEGGSDDEKGLILFMNKDILDVQAIFDRSNELYDKLTVDAKSGEDHQDLDDLRMKLKRVTKLDSFLLFAWKFFQADEYRNGHDDRDRDDDEDDGKGNREGQGHVDGRGVEDESEMNWTMIDETDMKEQLKIDRREREVWSWSRSGTWT